jgi:hypothetical protein
VRLLVLFLLAVLLAYGIWVLSSGAEDPVAPASIEEVEREPTPDELRMRERLGQKTGTLSVRGHTTDGEFPAGLEVGYVRSDGTVRWQYAVNGSKTFTDAPLGMVEAAARAAGYPESRQMVQVIADVPSAAVVLLRPETDDDEKRE